MTAVAAALRRDLEAILFLADEPVPLQALCDAVQHDVTAVRPALDDLRRDYDDDRRGMVVREAGGGWRLYSAPQAGPAVERFVLAGRTGRLTQAALETLAVVAYKQPVSRQQIGDIRGVDADAAVRSLVARGLVREVGRGEGPGQAILYGTTTAFLERLGLRSLDELPDVTDFLPEAPAPEEPALGALAEARRRLSEAVALATEAQARGRPAPGETADATAGDIDALTGALDVAARAAAARLRGAVAAAEDDGTTAVGTSDSQPPRDGPRGG